MQYKGKNLCDFCFQPVEEGKVCPHCGLTKDTYTTDAGLLPVGANLNGKYIIGRVLGRGGFGATYIAYSSALGKPVAIKEYMPLSITYRGANEGNVTIVSEDKRQVFDKGAKRFFEEAKTISKFNKNKNVVSVYEFFYANNTVYYSMELLDGVDLKKYISNKGGKLEEREVISILKSLCNALMIVHSTQTLHRDISPDNIFMCKDGTVKLIDFGAAKQVVSEENQAYSVVVKQGFAPSEQYTKKGKQGVWTDIYAAGATMYYALTGKVPPDAIARVEEPELDMSSVAVSKEFAGIIKKCMEIRIPDRYQSVIELMGDLEDIPVPAPAPVPESEKVPQTEIKPDVASVTGSVPFVEEIAVTHEEIIGDNVSPVTARGEDITPPEKKEKPVTEKKVKPVTEKKVKEKKVKEKTPEKKEAVVAKPGKEKKNLSDTIVANKKFIILIASGVLAILVIIICILLATGNNEPAWQQGSGVQPGNTEMFAEETTEPIVEETPEPTCPECGSTEHTTHPTPEPEEETATVKPKAKATAKPKATVKPKTKAKCPVCGSTAHTTHPKTQTQTQTQTKPKCPVCGSTAHTTHPVQQQQQPQQPQQPATPKCPVCGSTAHTSHPVQQQPATCPACGSKSHTVHPSGSAPTIDKEFN